MPEKLLLYLYTISQLRRIAKTYTFVQPYNIVEHSNKGDFFTMSQNHNHRTVEDDSPRDHGNPEALPSDVVINPSDEEVDPRLQLRDNLSDALAGTRFGDAVVLPLDVAQELGKDHLREIVDYLRDNEVESISDLSEELDVNTGNLSRHLNTLMKYDVIAIEKNGNAKKPCLKYDHVLIEPVY